MPSDGNHCTILCCYLVELREAHHFSSTGVSGIPVAVNELVMVQEGLQRGFWRVGQLIIGKDSEARGDKVKVSSRDGTVTTLQQKLSKFWMCLKEHQPLDDQLEQRMSWTDFITIDGTVLRNCKCT